jgi:hypothetical protein
VEIHRIWKLNDAYQLALKVEVKLAWSGAKKHFEVHGHNSLSNVENFESKLESSTGWANKSASTKQAGEQNNCTL